MSHDEELLKVVKLWGAALNECDRAHACGDEVTRVASAEMAQKLHARLTALATQSPAPQCAAPQGPAVPSGWMRHPLIDIDVPEWFVDLYRRFCSDPRRVTGCPGCDTFGLCALHVVPPENRPRKGHPRAVGEAPEARRRGAKGTSDAGSRTS